MWFIVQDWEKTELKKNYILLKVFPEIQTKIFRLIFFKGWTGIYKVIFLAGKIHHPEIFY